MSLITLIHCELEKSPRIMRIWNLLFFLDSSYTRGGSLRELAWIVTLPLPLNIFTSLLLWFHVIKGVDC